MTDARILTVRQPWARALVEPSEDDVRQAVKPVENRGHGLAGTTHRGLLLIHAGAAWSTRGGTDPRIVAAYYDETDEPIRSTDDRFTRSAVLGFCQLVDAHLDAHCCRPWGESEYAEAGGRIVRQVAHLVLEDPVMLVDPIPYTAGGLGLRCPPPDLVDAVLTAPRARRMYRTPTP